MKSGNCVHESLHFYSFFLHNHLHPRGSGRSRLIKLRVPQYVNNTVLLHGFKFYEYFTLQIGYLGLSISEIRTNSVKVCFKLLENKCNINGVDYYTFL